MTAAADRALLRTILGREGYTVYEVAKGRDALKKAKEVRPHIVILDVNLPDMSGLKVCRADPRRQRDRQSTGLDADGAARRFRCARRPGGGSRRLRRQGLPPAQSCLARVRRLIQFRQMSSVAMLNQQLVQVGRLLAGIVHEIRGPLAVIRGSAEVIQLSRAARQ